MSQEKAMFISLGSPTADSLNLSRGNPTVYGRTIKQLPSHLVPLFRIGSFSKTLVWVAWKYIWRETKTCFCTEAKGNCHCGGAVVSWLARSLQNERPGSSPDRGHCVVFLGKTVCSHSASLNPGVKMGTGKLNVWVPPSRGRRYTPSLGVMLQKPG